MNTALRFCQLNIEMDKHLNRVIPFLADQQFDIVCLQEIAQESLSVFEKKLDMRAILVPMTKDTYDGVTLTKSIAILSHLPILNTRFVYYAGTYRPNVILDRSSARAKEETEGYALLSCDVEKDGVPFRFITTHFPWTPNGEASEFQQLAVGKMCTALESFGDYILCGDLNAPRGKEIFTGISAKLIDHIPARYTTSIDASLHRAGALELMVDAIFSTSDYEISDVAQVCGLSDHCAFTGVVRHSTTT